MSSAQDRAAGYDREAAAQAGNAPQRPASSVGQTGGQTTMTGHSTATGQAGGYGQPGYGQAGYREADYPQEYSGRSGAAGGFTALAATLMILSGLWSFFVGITGVLKQAFYVAVPNYTFNYSIHAWGWTHLILGAVVFAAGVCLLLGMMWARVVGVILAVISGIANFLFLPHYPIWSIIVIALDVFIIWALTTGTSRSRQSV